MVKRLPARGVLLLLLLISIGVRAQTTPRETYDYGQPTNCGSACNGSTLTSGLRIPAVPSGTAGSTVTIPSNAFVYPFGSYNFTGGNTQATCTLTDAATIAWSATTCSSSAAKGTGFQFVQLGGNRTLGCGTGITAGNDGQVVVFYIQQPGSGGPYTLTPTTSCQWTVNSLNSSNNFNLGTIANEIDELITHTIYYSGSTYLVVDNLIPNINAVGSTCVWSATQLNSNLTGGGTTTVTHGGTTGTYETAFGASSKTTGKFYWETINNGITNSGDETAGIGNTSSSVANGSILGGTTTDTVGAYSIPSNGQFRIYYNGGIQSATGNIGAGSGDRVAHALDLTNGYYWAQNLTHSSGWIGASTGANPATPSGGFNLNGSGVTVLAHPVVPGITVFNTGDTGVGYFASSSWTGTPPSGFGSICGL